MRVITEESIKAFYNKRKFKKRNMQVEVSYNSAKLKLYGHTIAEVDESDHLYISTCGYNTRTTIDRLNGLKDVHVTFAKKQLKLNGHPWSGELTQIL
jgi:hypothetical protein